MSNASKKLEFGYDGQGTWRAIFNKEYSIDSRPNADHGFWHEAYHLGEKLYDGPDFSLAKSNCQWHTDAAAAKATGTTTRFTVNPKPLGPEEKYYAIKDGGGDSLQGWWWTQSNLADAERLAEKLNDLVVAVAAEKDKQIVALRFQWVDQIEDKDKRITELEKDRADWKDKHSEVAAYSDELNRHITDLEQQLASKTAALADAQTANSILGKMADERYAEIAEKRKQLADRECQIEQADAACDRVREELSRSKSQIVELERQILNSHVPSAKGGRWSVAAIEEEWCCLLLDGKRILADAKGEGWAIFNEWSRGTAQAAADFLNSVTAPAATAPAKGPYEAVMNDDGETWFIRGTLLPLPSIDEQTARDLAHALNLAHEDRLKNSK